MKEGLYSARADLPWYGDGRYYEMTSGKRTSDAKFIRSPWAFACMNIRGQELANIPWHIKKKDKVLDKHELIDMLEDFGPESSYQRGMLYTEIDLLNYGAALWLRDHDILKRLDPGTIEVKKTNEGIVKFIQTLTDQDGTQKKITYKREEIVYFREYHPDDDLDFGVPVIDVCKRAINAEVEALLMIEAYYKNDAVPGLYLGSDKHIAESEGNRILNWWNSRFRGGRNKGKVGVGGDGLKPYPIGNNMKDSAVVELLDSVRNDICVAFRVPKVLVGSQLEATYVNLNESRKFLIEDVLIPRAIEYQNVINQDLVPYVDPSVTFEFAFDELQILQEDATEKHNRLADACSRGFISEDYYRREMGYPAGSEPDEEAKEEKRREKEALQKFEKKSVKAFLRGEDPNVPFESDYIPIDKQYVIRGRLQNATTEEAVRSCFT